MGQRPLRDPTAPAAAPDTYHAAAPRPSAELRIERSRFSRLLARFGLGELTDPILRPINRAAGRGHAG